MLQHNDTGVAVAAPARARRQVLPSARVVVSSRVRLARNVRGVPFPNWTTIEERRALLEKLAPAVLVAVNDPAAVLIGMADLEERQREVLMERWLVSRDLAQRADGAAVVVAHKGSVAVMINEEDHIRIQVINPGLSLAQCHEMADAIDTRLERLLPYAFSRRLGYLTACPSNIGTGMRASVMVHMPGLRLTGDIDATIRALERLRLNVRGIGGEGSAAAGHRFQISNQGTLGSEEATVVAALERVAREVTLQEETARLRALRSMPLAYEDCLARSLSLLKEARLMQTEEALDYLSAVRMGLEMGVLRGLKAEELAKVEMQVLPGHMQDFFAMELDAEKRDQYRAQFLNERLQGCVIDTGKISGTEERVIAKRKRK